MLPQFAAFLIIVITAAGSDQHSKFQLLENADAGNGIVLDMGDSPEASQNPPKAKGVVMQAQFQVTSPIIMAPYPNQKCFKYQARYSNEASLSQLIGLGAAMAKSFTPNTPRDQYVINNSHEDEVKPLDIEPASRPTNFINFHGKCTTKAPTMRQDLGAEGMEAAMAELPQNPLLQSMEPPPEGAVALDPHSGFTLTDGQPRSFGMKPLKAPMLGQSPENAAIYGHEMPQSPDMYGEQQQMMMEGGPRANVQSAYELPVDGCGMPLLDLPCDDYLRGLCSGNPNCCKPPSHNPSLPMGHGCMRKELGTGECEFIRASCHRCGFCQGAGKYSGVPCAPMQKVFEKQFMMDGSSVLLRIRAAKKTSLRH